MWVRVRALGKIQASKIAISFPFPCKPNKYTQFLLPKSRPLYNNGSRSAPQALLPSPPPPVPLLLLQIPNRPILRLLFLVLLEEGLGPHRATLGHRLRREEARGGGPGGPDPPEGPDQHGPHRPGVPPARGDRRVLCGVRGEHRPGVARQASSKVVRGGVRPQAQFQG